MACRGCSRCVHGGTAFEYDGKLKDNYVKVSEGADSVLGAMYATCNAGNTEAMANWWKENKDIPVSKVSDMPCFESTEIDRKLDSIIDLCNNLLDKEK